MAVRQLNREQLAEQSAQISLIFKDGVQPQLSRSRGRLRASNEDGSPRYPVGQEVADLVLRVSNGLKWVKTVTPNLRLSHKIIIVDNTYGERIEFLTRPRGVVHHGVGAPKYTVTERSQTRAINSGLTDDAIRAKALEFDNRWAFQKHAARYYNAAHRRGLLDDVCAHMERLGSKYYRHVYSISLGNEIYIGLSQNPTSRFRHHEIRGTKKVRDLIARGGTLKVLSDLIPTAAAAEMEARLICVARYEEKVVLNAKAGGGIGGAALIWDTEAKIASEAAKYPSRKDFSIGSSGAYEAARSRGLLDKLFPSGPYGWRKTPEGRLKLSRAVGGGPFESIDIATGERRVWQTQADCRDELGLNNISNTLAGKHPWVGTKAGLPKARYTLRYLTPDEIAALSDADEAA